MEWISVDDRLPEIKKDKTGNVNFVLVYIKYHVECGCDIQLYNTEYVNKNHDDLIHKNAYWMELPEPPKG